MIKGNSNKFIIFIAAALVLGGGIAALVLSRTQSAMSEVPSDNSQQASSDSVPQGQQGAAPGGAWARRCTSQEKSSCEIFQRIVMKQNNLRLIEVALSLPGDGKDARLGIVMPLGVLVSSGIAVQIDESAPHQGNIRTCGQNGCLALLDMPQGFVRSMQDGEILNVGFFDGSGKPVKIRMSLNGFSETFKSIQ